MKLVAVELYCGNKVVSRVRVPSSTPVTDTPSKRRAGAVSQRAGWPGEEPFEALRSGCGSVRQGASGFIIKPRLGQASLSAAPPDDTGEKFKRESLTGQPSIIMFYL